MRAEDLIDEARSLIDEASDLIDEASSLIDEASDVIDEASSLMNEARENAKRWSAGVSPAGAWPSRPRRARQTAAETQCPECGAPR